MRGAEKYDSSKLVCHLHRVNFVKFTYGRGYSFGCPVCVAEIRDQVHKERRSRKNLALRSDKISRTGTKL